MGREGWIYLFVFLLVLGAGAALIAPALKGPGAVPTPEGEGDPALAPDVPPSGATEPPPPPPPLRVRVRAATPDGRLDGALGAVEGATVTALEGEAAAPDLVLAPTAPAIAFRARGHRPQVVPVARLRSQGEVRLEPAAPPLVLEVLEPDGTPAVGVPLRLRPALPGPAPRTGAGGRALLDELTPGLLIVEVGADERDGPVLRLVAGEDREVTARLAPAFVVEGRVVEAGGRPVPGARVSAAGAGGLVGSRPVTGDDGRFTWRGPVDDVLAFEVLAPPHAPALVEVSPPARGPLRHDVGDVVLGGAGAALEGRLRVPAGLGPPRVTVEVAVRALLLEVFGPDAVRGGTRAVRVDADGRFQVEGLVPGLPYRVAVREAGVPVDHEVRVPAGAVARFELAPPAGQILEGRVVDGEEGGAPVQGLVLLVSSEPRDEDRVLPGDHAVTTDADGRFRLGGLAPGQAYLRAYPSGRRAVLRRLVLPRAAPLDLTLELPVAAPRLEGVVVDGENAPLPGVVVRAAGREAVADDAGRFLLTGVESFGGEVEVAAAFEPGRPSPAVDPRPFAAGVVRRTTLEAGPIKLVLPRTRTLELRAVDGVDDVPLAFVHAVVRTDDGQLVADRALAPVDGAVTLGGLPPRGVTVALFSHRHRFVRAIPLRADVAPPPVIDLGEVRLTRGMRIVGRVLDARGVPVPRARIGGLEEGWLRTQGDDPTLRRELLLRHVETDAEGRFSFEGLDPRRPALLAAWADGFAPVARRAVLEKFREDVSVSLDIVLRRGGWLAVDLIEQGTELPVSGAVFDLEDARTSSDYLDVLRRGMLGGAVASTRDWELASRHFLFEREPGSYRLGPVAPGPYDVWVERPGYRPLERKLTILDPEEGRIDVLKGTAHRIDLVGQVWEMVPGE